MKAKVLTSVALALVLGSTAATAATAEKPVSSDKEYVVFTDADNGFMRIHPNEAGEIFR